MSVRTSIVPPGPRPLPADTPGTSASITTPQVTASHHDFAVSLGWNRIEAQFTALRYFALDGTDHASHHEQASMIRRYIIWRNNHAYDQRLRQVVARATAA